MVKQSAAHLRFGVSLGARSLALLLLLLLLSSTRLLLLLLLGCCGLALLPGIVVLLLLLRTCSVLCILAGLQVQRMEPLCWRLGSVAFQEMMCCSSPQRM